MPKNFLKNILYFVWKNEFFHIYLWIIWFMVSFLCVKKLRVRVIKCISYPYILHMSIYMGWQFTYNNILRVVLLKTYHCGSHRTYLEWWKMVSNNICRGRALRIGVEFTALAILLLAGSSGAATLTVCSSDCTYTSIQAAIHRCSLKLSMYPSISFY